MKKLNVTVFCRAQYYSSIDVPDNMSLQEAIEYAKENMHKLFAEDVEIIPNTDELDEKNCEFEESFSEPVNPVAVLMTKIEEKAEEKKAKTKAIAARKKLIFQSVEELKDRIQILMQLANKCLEEGFEIPKKFFSTEANGWQTGFMEPSNGMVQYIVISIHDYCGLSDVCTDGDDIFTKKQSRKPPCFSVWGGMRHLDPNQIEYV